MNQLASDPQLSLAQCATMACLLEVTAPKPGNVHRSADFEDVSFVDFVASAVAIGPAISDAAESGIGLSVLQAVQATRNVTSTNTNLGTILLLAPLAAVPIAQPLGMGIDTVLTQLSPNDADCVYRAIRMANPGGLGKADTMDIRDEPPEDLHQAMAAAADRDMIASQYENRFATVLDEVMPWLVDARRQGWSLTESIIHTQLRLLSKYPDSLILRKCGDDIAGQASTRATRALNAGSPRDSAYLQQLNDLDFWMRSDGHRRNPGTTADLIAAGLFAGLREGLIRPEN